jgi:pilus assembly protein CpaC
VRVVEVSRDIIKAFGVNWAGAAQSGTFAFGLATGVGGITESTPILQGLNKVLVGYHAGTTDLNTVIDALDSEGLVTVLAEPNLTAVSGAAASFLAGGEYPIPVPQGLGQVSVSYKKYGVSLGFVATITDGGRINLVVKPEVSQLSNVGAVTVSNITVPALTTRRAETTVDLASGQSFAIAGLMQNNVAHALQKFPGLGNVPIIGALFRSDRFERNETELVVIVTPYIVRPSDHRLSVPTDGFVPATDSGRILRGEDSTPPAVSAKPVATPKGTKP